MFIQVVSAVAALFGFQGAIGPQGSGDLLHLVGDFRRSVERGNAFGGVPDGLRPVSVVRLPTEPKFSFHDLTKCRLVLDCPQYMDDGLLYERLPHRRDIIHSKARQAGFGLAPEGGPLDKLSRSPVGAIKQGPINEEVGSHDHHAHPKPFGRGLSRVLGVDGYAGARALAVTPMQFSAVNMDVSLKLSPLPVLSNLNRPSGGFRGLVGLSNSIASSLQGPAQQGKSNEGKPDLHDGQVNDVFGGPRRKDIRLIALWSAVAALCAAGWGYFAASVNVGNNLRKEDTQSD